MIKVISPYWLFILKSIKITVYSLEFSRKFVQKVNSDLIGKLVNIASRNASFISKKFDGILSDKFENQKLYDEFLEAANPIANFYEKREFSLVIRQIITLANKANQYIDEKAPWVLAKENDKSELLHEVCSLGINLFRILTCYIKPVLPNLAEKTEDFLNIEPMQWNSINNPLFGHKIKQYQPLMTRVDKEKVISMTNDAKKEMLSFKKNEK